MRKLIKIAIVMSLVTVISLLAVAHLPLSAFRSYGIALFLLAFGVLLLLLLLYRRQQGRQKELLAFRSAVENSDNIVVVTDPDRHIEYVNAAFEKQTGYSKEEVYGKVPSILKSGLMADEIYAELNATLERGEKWQGELINRRKDGSLIYEKISIVPIFMDDVLTQYLAIKLDVTEYINQKKALEKSAIVYQNMSEAVLITDADKKILSYNRAFCEIFGYLKEELQGKDPQTIIADTQQIVPEKVENILEKTGRWSGRVKIRCKDNTVMPVWLTIVPVRNSSGAVENYISIYTNLGEIIAMEERMHFLAYHDSLTRLPNRVECVNRISDIVRLRSAEGGKTAILFIDLDRFKMINDTLGHHVGDSMLVELSRRMERVLGQSGILFRIGGDEFVVMVDIEKDEAEVRVLAQMLLSNIRKPIQVNNYHLHTTASIGIAIYPDHGSGEADLMKHADAAMYHAKAQGQNTYCFYSSTLSKAIERRLLLEQTLPYALERKEFTLHYQPQYGLDSRSIIGVEVLLRWQNSRLGHVSPEEFIPVAADTGLIIAIGYHVLEEACKAYRRWQAAGVTLERLSVNISSVQFQEEEFVEKFQEIMSKYDMPPSAVELEITERFFLEYSTRSVEMLKRFRHLGCRIAIDDFGTGYSSMRYLKELPLDTIKIDRSFIQNVPYETSDNKVIKAIVALSHSLGYQVVAEGIETKEQEEYLRMLHCNLGQGYLFARPMDEEALMAFFLSKEHHENSAIEI